jgi:hypothetical protein
MPDIRMICYFFCGRKQKFSQLFLEKLKIKKNILSPSRFFLIFNFDLLCLCHGAILGRSLSS